MEQISQEQYRHQLDNLIRLGLVGLKEQQNSNNWKMIYYFNEFDKVIANHTFVKSLIELKKLD